MGKTIRRKKADVAKASKANTRVAKARLPKHQMAKAARASTPTTTRNRPRHDPESLFLQRLLAGSTVELVGRGSGANVYGISNHPRYVIKRFNDPTSIGARQEMKTSSILFFMRKNNDPISHMCKIYNVFPNNGIILMEKARGEELFKVYTRLSVPERFLIIKRLISHSLSCLKHNYVNTDLKLENVMYDKESGTIIVVDAGSVVTKDSLGSKHPRSLTMECAPSEFFFPGSRATEVSGLYILASLIYEILCLGLPYLHDYKKPSGLDENSLELHWKGFVQKRKRDIFRSKDTSLLDLSLLSECESCLTLPVKNREMLISALQSGLNPDASKRPTLSKFSSAVFSALKGI